MTSFFYLDPEPKGKEKGNVSFNQRWRGDWEKEKRDSWVPAVHHWKKKEKGPSLPGRKRDKKGKGGGG